MVVATAMVVAAAASGAVAATGTTTDRLDPSVTRPASATKIDGMLPDAGALYRDHAAAVWRYVRARVPTDADAEDVASDVFTRALRAAGGYRPELGTPRAWLVGIARHAAADWWRRRRPEDPHAELPEPAGATAGHDPAEEHERAMVVDDVRRLLDLLNERERDVISLRFGAELSSAEIGDVMGVSPTAARMLLHRAVTKLRGGDVR